MAFWRFVGKAVPVLVLFGGAQSVHAGAVLFSDISPTFLPTGIAISGATSAFLSAGAFGFGFSPSTTALLGQIDVGAIFYVSGTNSVQFTLNSDSSGLPGAVLDTWNVSNLPTSNPVCCTLETLIPHASITLNSSAEYWLIAYPGAADTYADWRGNGLGISGPYAYTLDGGATFTPLSGVATGVFDVLASDVPEPRTFALLAAGIGLCLVRRYHGRDADNAGLVLNGDGGVAGRVYNPPVPGKSA
jgi:hypothetical protein